MSRHTLTENYELAHSRLTENHEPSHTVHGLKIISRHTLD